MTANKPLASAPVAGFGSPTRAPRAQGNRPALPCWMDLRRPFPLSLAPGFSRVFAPAQPRNSFNGFSSTTPEAATAAYPFSPNGAAPYQPRAKRSVALGSLTHGNLALKGRTTGVGGHSEPSRRFVRPVPSLRRPFPLSLASGFSRVFAPAQPRNRFNGFSSTGGTTAPSLVNHDR